jgi:ribosomal-protein-alanine N-acetyltransferase
MGNVAVDPIYRRQGIAHEVMRRILEACREVRRVELVTHPENQDALRLYKSLGFVVEGRIENYFGDGEPRLLLALSGHLPQQFGAGTDLSDAGRHL